MSIVAYYFIVPSLGPSSVRVSNVGVTSISLEWGEVNCEDRNGEITGYSVRYGPSSSTPSQTAAVEGRALTLSIDGLLIRTSYSFRVAAVNGNGTGVYSSAVTGTTAVPTGVRH